MSAIVSTVVFEGNSDPDDMTIMYAAETASGTAP